MISEASAWRLPLAPGGAKPFSFRPSRIIWEYSPSPLV